MLYTLKNEQIKICVSSFGAELQSLESVADTYEYLWQGNAESWNSRSPVLFPFIGTFPESVYSYCGKTYKVDNHGFARKSEFRLMSEGDNSLSFSLFSDAATREIFPFDFILNITYTIVGSRVSITYRVTNTGKELMLFSIGGHPGFNCPLEDGLDFSDYRLVFSTVENSQRRFKDQNLLTGKRGTSLSGQKVLPLEYTLFSQGALIYDDLISTRISLESEHGVRKVHMDFSGFPYFGIWSYKAFPQPFICLEPWFGIDATIGDSSELAGKEGLLELEPEQVFSCIFSIEVE